MAQLDLLGDPLPQPVVRGWIPECYADESSAQKRPHPSDWVRMTAGIAWLDHWTADDGEVVMAGHALAEGEAVAFLCHFDCGTATLTIEHGAEDGVFIHTVSRDMPAEADTVAVWCDWETASPSVAELAEALEEDGPDEYRIVYFGWPQTRFTLRDGEFVA